MITRCDRGCRAGDRAVGSSPIMRAAARGHEARGRGWGSAAGAEEGAEDLGAFLGEYALADLDAVGQAGVADQVP